MSRRLRRLTLILATLATCTSSAAEWPSFRGPSASGVADGQKLPDQWDGVSGKNVVWKTPVPGLAHSSPIVHGARLFITTAISSREGAGFKPGLYGSGEASDDRSAHRWLLYCLDCKKGKVLWKRVVAKGIPKDKRHIKSTYANSTPVTDGRRVVCFFGSEGLFAYDVDGGRLWRRDLGRLDVGAYDVPYYEWGTASSPIIYRDLAIVQCDTQGESFIIAIDLATGKTRWKTPRDELPSWGTPTVYDAPARDGFRPLPPELITNGSKFIRGYNPLSGKELWRLGGSSKITAPTPIFHDGLIVVASGRAPERPIFAIRAGSRGDLTLARGETSSQRIAWSKVRRGPYMPTPIIYRDALYVLHNQGILDSHDLRTGKAIFRERIPHAGSGFSASPVAADGKLYLPSEDGDIFVVKAGTKLQLLAKNRMGELLMATPALAGGRMYVRTKGRVFAIGK